MVVGHCLVYVGGVCSGLKNLRSLYSGDVLVFVCIWDCVFVGPTFCFICVHGEANATKVVGGDFERIGNIIVVC